MADSNQLEYIRARCALLDALEGLEAHRHSIILIGAQAIYLHTGATEFTVPEFTYDADLALDPRSLTDDPRIIEAMQEAGFSQTDQPGIFRNDHSQVDLLVPAALGGRPGHRGAGLGPHGNLAAMQVRGIEGALVDHQPMWITALDRADSRSFVVEVAGPAALLVAKVHKVAERTEEPAHRQDDKDAFDIYRLLLAIQTEELATNLKRLRDHELSATVSQEALSLFEEHFGDRTSTGTRMVVRNVAGLEDPDFIAASCVSLSQDLLNAL
ncbi:MAG: GSU2403 family nucleotidyltransferase fold protein [Dehalococcoidia bacterium]